MFTKAVSIITVSIGLSSCFQLPLSSNGKLDQSTISGAAEPAVSTNVGTTKAIATIDPDSKTPTQLTAPRVEGLSGASVIIPPGSLGIAADIVIEQAADFGETSLTSEMGLAADIQVSSASPGMIIRPTENVDLKKPLSLAMPLPSSFGFRLADAGSKYAIFYKYFDPTEQRLVTGFKVVDGLTVKLAFDEKSGHDIIQFEGYFGAYWATTLSREVKPSEVPPAKPAEAPIVNKANVSVIETKGIVKETEIVKTQAIPELVWTKPSIKFLAATRSVSVSIPVPTGRTVSGCKIDLYENPTKPDGLSLEAPLGTSIEFAVVRTTEHSLVGRFRCFDDQGRTSVTPWSDAIVVPAVIVASATESVLDGTCANPQVIMEARQYGVASSENMLLPAKGNCHYAGTLMMNEVDSFYIARADSSMVCGLPTHNLIEGVQTLKCVKATSANIGGDFLTIPRGNYSYDLDFSKSALAPTLTIARLPCSMTDMHILFHDTYSSMNPSFPAVSAANKMTHVGGCEFVYDTQTAPTTTADGKVTFVSTDYAKYCGNIEYTTYFGNTGMIEGLKDYDHKNLCSTTPRYFKMPAYTTGISGYHFSVKMGISAKEKDQTADSAVRLERESSCPRRLYLYSNDSGQTAMRGVNDAEKKDACSYEFYYAADKPVADLQFKIGDETKTKLCGYADPSASDNSTVSCTAAAYPVIPATYQAGRVYKVSVNGDGITGNINEISIAPLPDAERSCDGGLYASSAIANGFFNDAAKAFIETRECVFERVWTPTVANESFYVHNGRNTNFCGSDGSPDRQLTVGGAAAPFWCRGSLSEVNDVSAIQPLNAVVNTAYRIFADHRFPHQVRMKVLPNAPSSCADDVFIQSTGTVLPSSTKMTSKGNCNYTLDFTVPVGAGSTFPYTVSIGGSTCGYTSVHPNAAGLDRTADLNCSTGDPLTFSGSQVGRSFRFTVKRDPNSTNASVTLQDISRDISNFQLAGAAGGEKGTPMFGSPSLLPNVNLYNTYDWLVGSQNTFLMQRYMGGSNFLYCGLAASAPLPTNGVAVDMQCNLNVASLSSARVFQNSWALGNTIRLEVLGNATYEGPYKLKATPYTALAPAALNMFKGTTSANQTAMGTLGVTGDSSATPQALMRSATWTDASGNLWLYGGTDNTGNTRGELWKFDGSNWILVFGDYTAASPMTVAGVRPGARTGAATWVQGTRLYLLGGYGVGNFSGSPSLGYLSDLWYWETNGGGWNFVSGVIESNTAAINGALNVENVTYRPGARAGATVWKDSSNNVFLFGGIANAVLVNDMWKLNASSGYWSWVGGLPDAQDSGMIPSPRSYAASWYVDSALYLFGGNLDDSNKTSTEMWMFSAGSWTKKRDDDAANYERTIVQSRVYNPLNKPGRFGNQTLGTSSSWLSSSGNMYLYSQAVLWQYDRSTNQWAALLQDQQENNLAPDLYPYYQTLNSPSTGNYMGNRIGPTVWTKGNQMYLFGGHSTTGLRSDLWEISLP